ncbi:MAG TPA: hypothetical protein VG843_01035, partial [Rhizomicrobium sp.]|nr:hypothetical protein [Rhizomicrobium sp.]
MTSPQTSCIRSRACLTGLDDNEFAVRPFFENIENRDHATDSGFAAQRIEPHQDHGCASLAFPLRKLPKIEIVGQDCALLVTGNLIESAVGFAAPALEHIGHIVTRASESCDQHSIAVLVRQYAHYSAAIV